MDSLHDPLTNFRQEDIVREASRLFDRLASFYTPAAHPCAILLGGQPGAGKSTIAEKLAEELEGEVMTISGDDFRQFHPNHAKLAAKYGKDATPAASAFSGAVTELLKGLCARRKYRFARAGGSKAAAIRCI